MKIAVVYNSERQSASHPYSRPCLEKYGLDAILDIRQSLENGGHQVEVIEGDQLIIEKLKKFMHPTTPGQIPGIVLNLCYGIQGKCRYTHMPGILEMIGIPYTGSGPDVHAVALNKVVTKLLVAHAGLPTPRFTVMAEPDTVMSCDLRYPLIIKPKDETSSLGLRKVTNVKELREGVSEIQRIFRTETLVEEYIDGREINVGLLGNKPVLTLPPVELRFGEGPGIYTFEDKMKISGRTVEKICPASLTPEKTREIQQMAIDTYNAVGCLDMARVDFRLDREGNPFILEINSMPSLHRESSFAFAAEKMGLYFDDFINELIEITHARYTDQLITE